MTKLFKFISMILGSNSIAFSAISFPNIIFWVSSIFESKFMPSTTMSFSGIVSRVTNPPQQIFFFTNRFKMFGVYTKSISAQMINFKIFRNWTFNQFISYAMRPSHCPTFFGFNSKFTVTKGIFMVPIPTIISFIDSFPESFFHSQAGWSHKVLVRPQGGA